MLFADSKFFLVNFGTIFTVGKELPRYWDIYGTYGTYFWTLIEHIERTILNNAQLRRLTDFSAGAELVGYLLQILEE